MDGVADIRTFPRAGIEGLRRDAKYLVPLADTIQAYNLATMVDGGDNLGRCGRVSGGGKGNTI